MNGRLHIGQATREIEREMFFKVSRSCSLALTVYACYFGYFAIFPLENRGNPKLCRPQMTKDMLQLDVIFGAKKSQIKKRKVHGAGLWQNLSLFQLLKKIREGSWFLHYSHLILNLRANGGVLHVHQSSWYIITMSLSNSLSLSH